MHKCGFQPALPSQLGKKRLHGMCGQFLSRLSELTRQATAAVPATRQGGTTRFAFNRNVKIIDNTQPRPRPVIFIIFLIFSAFSHEKTGTR